MHYSLVHHSVSHKVEREKERKKRRNILFLLKKNISWVIGVVICSLLGFVCFKAGFGGMPEAAASEERDAWAFVVVLGCFFLFLGFGAYLNLRDEVIEEKRKLHPKL